MTETGNDRENSTRLRGRNETERMIDREHSTLEKSAQKRLRVIQVLELFVHSTRVNMEQKEGKAALLLTNSHCPCWMEREKGGKDIE